MDEEPKIEIREVKEDDFRKGILAGEVKPHDVEITIKYRNGTNSKTEKIPWAIIESLYKWHNRCAVGDMYEMIIERDL